MFILFEKSKNLIIFGIGPPEKLQMCHGLYYVPFHSKDIIILDFSRYLETKIKSLKILRITIKYNFVFAIFYFLGFLSLFFYKYIFKILCLFLLVCISLSLYFVLKKDVVYKDDLQLPEFHNDNKALISLLKTDFANKVSLEKPFYSSGLLPKVLDISSHKVLPLVYFNGKYQGRSEAFLAVQYPVVYFLKKDFSFEKRFPLKECQFKQRESFWIYASYEDDLMALFYEKDRHSRGLNNYVLTSLNHNHNYTCQDFSEF